MKRDIVRIDEEKCDGCGVCIDSCAEGAIQLIDGKARLISESYCDGLGACLGECPQDAITIEKREATEFDPEAVEHHLAQERAGEAKSHTAPKEEKHTLACGCPGSATQSINRAQAEGAEAGPAPSLLGNWPVQIRLVPITAPYLDNAKLLIAADCVPFAFGDFHREFLEGKVLLIGCPKLDDADMYREKLAEMFRSNNIQSIDVAYMEVPCCFGLVRLVGQAVEDSGKEIPVTLTRVGIRGQILESNPLTLKA
jgi:NAD-dependent dihydropyrimidine dehydrogenase PreA subunit